MLGLQITGNGGDIVWIVWNGCSRQIDDFCVESIDQNIGYRAADSSRVQI